MSANPYSPPASDMGHDVPVDGAPALWNPSVAVGLAFFLSPIFGALINMKNWQAMGEPAKARQSIMWIYGTIGYYILLIVAAVFLPDASTPDLLFRGLGLGYFIAWYMVSGKDQKDVIEYRYGASYEKRGWTKPVLLSLGAYIGLIAVVTAIMIAVSPAQA